MNQKRGPGVLKATDADLNQVIGRDQSSQGNPSRPVISWQMVYT